MIKYTELLQQLRKDVKDLQLGEGDKLKTLLRRTNVLIRKISGESSRYIEDLEKISFYYPENRRIPLGGGLEIHRPYWETGKRKLLNLIDTLSEELLLSDSDTRENSKSQQQANSDILISKSIFVVHGHDNEMKESVARLIEKLKLEAVILHEQPNRGRTIIEKFMDYGGAVSFAIVLLSPDDIGFPKNQEISSGLFRARQNVILELGFFVGRLGRSNVVALYREADKFEMPTDIAGVLYISFDKQGNWQFQLIKELKAAGYEVDGNLLM